MNDIIPIFPLQLVVFPGESLNLHIFEPRYKQLIQDCEDEGITFGIPSYINQNLMPVGTILKLTEIVKVHPAGEMDIRTKGVNLFKINEFLSNYPNKLYSGAEVSWLNFDLEGEAALNEEILGLVRQLFKALKIAKQLPDNAATFSTYDIAHHVGFTLEQEYEFLSILKEFDRQQFMLEHLYKVMPMVNEMERLKERVKMNGHFKNIKPPRV